MIRLHAVYIADRTQRHLPIRSNRDYCSGVDPSFEKLGFLVARGLFANGELTKLHDVLQKFHQAWLADNADFYQERAVNSAYITSSKYLRDEERRVLFEFIGSGKIAAALLEVIPGQSAFGGSQLFFDPFNPEQKNYWHRDTQYNDWTIAQQKKWLFGTNALHFRVPLRRERGIELVPGTHRRWDTVEEFDIRKEQNGRVSSDNIVGTEEIALNRGDLLVFSGNMIHRGLYGGDRFAFDILFGDATSELVQFVASDALPTEALLENVQCPAAFLNTLRLIELAKSRASREDRK